MSSEHVTESNDDNFMTDVIATSNDVPVILDFWAPWCGPCKTLIPVLERVIESHGGAVKLVKINIDENKVMADQLHVRSIPAVFAMRNGKPVDGFVGNIPESQLKEFVAKQLTAGTDPVSA